MNVLGIVRTTRAALPLLRRAARERGQAAIVNTCSIAGTAGLPQRALYCASKGAVYALTLAMAADHVAEGIRVNCVNPGTVDTPWVGRLLDAAPDPAAERAALTARQPMGRLVTADEVAAAIAYLASPLAGATTGTALAVDGGMSGLRPGLGRPDPAPRTERLEFNGWRGGAHEVRHTLYSRICTPARRDPPPPRPVAPASGVGSRARERPGCRQPSDEDRARST